MGVKNFTPNLIFKSVERRKVTYVPPTAFKSHLIPNMVSVTAHALLLQRIRTINSTLLDILDFILCIDLPNLI